MHPLGSPNSTLAKSPQPTCLQAGKGKKLSMRVSSQAHRTKPASRLGQGNKNTYMRRVLIEDFEVREPPSCGTTCPPLFLYATAIKFAAYVDFTYRTYLCQTVIKSKTCVV